MAERWHVPLGLLETGAGDLEALVMKQAGLAQEHILAPARHPTRAGTLALAAAR